MKTLNLVNLEKSDIKYVISKFPDGQQQVSLDLKQPQSAWESYIRAAIPIRDAVQIIARLNNFKDLEIIACAVASLRAIFVKEIHLYTPYFLGSRSDRKFETGSNNYLRDVICPFINSLNFQSVTVIDPHSDVLEACLKNYRKLSNWSLVNWSVDQLAYGLKNKVFVSPDAGASKKIYDLAQNLGYEGDILTCSKHRDTQGKLTQTQVPYSLDYFHKDKIIIDDICDGGRTFINIAKELRSGPYKNSKAKIYLIVTHGIFSQGLNELVDHFNGIFRTNSYSDLEFGEPTPTGFFVNQLNVF